jgi:hypothetical protein
MNPRDMNGVPGTVFALALERLLVDTLLDLRQRLALPLKIASPRSDDVVEVDGCAAEASGSECRCLCREPVQVAALSKQHMEADAPWVASGILSCLGDDGDLKTDRLGVLPDGEPAFGQSSNAS